MPDVQTIIESLEPFNVMDYANSTEELVRVSDLEIIGSNLASISFDLVLAYNTIIEEPTHDYAGHVEHKFLDMELNDLWILQSGNSRLANDDEYHLIWKHLSK
jgi:hypothetical protein|tara:strand:+ start:6790 stop:7098 length:309 start_codon:yes stop_codon:yes gene_type:complete